MPGEKGLEGNSDADVVIHSLCRALEQSIGGESFSIYADDMHKRGIDSSVEYLKIAKSHVEEAGYRINNIGINIEAKKPRIIPIASQIRNNISQILNVDQSCISINATSGEDLTAFGRGEGIQVWTIVSLIKE